MKNVTFFSFYGGDQYCGEFSCTDFLVFFNCIKNYALNDIDQVITDRFYKRYIGINQLEMGLNQIKHIQKIFKEVRTSKVNFEMIGLDKRNTKLDIRQLNLDSVFSAFFYNFEEVCSMSKFYFEKYSKIKPVMILQADLENIMSFTVYGIDLDFYDSLQGPPFWLREYLQEYPDTVLPFE